MDNTSALRAAIWRSRASGLALVWSLALALLASFSLPAFAQEQATPGAVYTQTNAPTGNAIAVFYRSANGVLSPAGLVPTGGAGTGGNLGNQGAVVLSQDNRWLFAVNAGSNDISVFAISPKGLILVDRAASGGVLPVSLTLHNDLLYVLNAGGINNITGFTVGRRVPSLSCLAPRGRSVPPRRVRHRSSSVRMAVCWW
jgi:hypothetical protein